jgi:Integrase core domain
VRRDFIAPAPGQKMVGDITYIPTWEGWLYLATVIDCHTKGIIGWATDDNYKTPLISTAIRMATRNHDLTAGAIFHSDRGSNYTSTEFAGVLNELGIRQSVGRTGICYDNAMAESFFAALKTERVHRTQYPAREHAHRDIARYIELHYNTAGFTRHSATRPCRRSTTSTRTGRPQHRNTFSDCPENSERPKWWRLTPGPGPLGCEVPPTVTRIKWVASGCGCPAHRARRRC